MASQREALIHEERLNDHLASMPDYVQEFVQAKTRAKYSPSTLLGYIHEYIRFFNWLKQEGIAEINQIKDMPLSVLENLSKKNAEFFIEYLEQEKIIKKKGSPPVKRSTAAVTRSINAIKSLFNYLTTETEDEETGECYFYRNVFSKIKTNKKSEDTANSRAEKISSVILKDEEVIEFIEYLKHSYSLPLSSRQRSIFNRDKERDIALISIMLGSGVRVSEAASLTMEDINFPKEKLNVIRKGNKHDTINVMTTALEDLKTYLRVRDTRYPGAKDTPYVFVSKYGGTARPLSVRAIQDLVMKYTKAFNSQGEFSTGKPLSPHKFRHTFASDWVRNGGDLILLRNQLGHNSIETTQKYTNLSSEDGKRFMKKLEKSRHS